MTMTPSSTQKAQRDWSAPFNLVLYFSFVMLAFYFLAVNKDLSAAMSNMGLALIFDPFKHDVSWAKRPAYQRIWLILHVTIVFVLLSIMLFRELF